MVQHSSHSSSLPFTTNFLRRPTSFARNKNSSACRPSTLARGILTQTVGNGAQIFSVILTRPSLAILRYCRSWHWPRTSPSRRLEPNSFAYVLDFRFNMFSFCLLTISRKWYSPAGLLPFETTKKNCDRTVHYISSSRASAFLWHIPRNLFRRTSILRN